MKQSGHVNAARDDLIASLDLTRQTFAGEGGSVQSGFSLHHGTVNGNFLARLYHDDGADTHLVWVYLFELAIPFNVSVVWTDVHEFAYVAARFANSIGLEPFAYLIEQHNCNAFQIITVFVDSQSQSTNGGNRHQEVLVKDLAIADTFIRFSQNIITNNEIVYQIQRQSYPAPGCPKLVKNGGTQSL